MHYRVAGLAEYSGWSTDVFDGVGGGMPSRLFTEFLEELALREGDELAIPPLLHSRFRQYVTVSLSSHRRRDTDGGRNCRSFRAFLLLLPSRLFSPSIILRSKLYQTLLLINW